MISDLLTTPTKAALLRNMIFLCFNKSQRAFIVQWNEREKYSDFLPTKDLKTQTEIIA